MSNVLNTSAYDFTDIPALTKEHELSPYSQFYYLPVSKPDPKILECCLSDAMDPGNALPVENLGRIFERDGTPLKNGWCIMEDGTGFSSVCTKMPGVTAEMEAWWGTWFTQPEYDFLNYRIWLPGLHVSHSMPIVENLGWGLVAINIERMLSPEMINLPDAPEKMDPDYMHCIISCGNCGLISPPAAELQSNVIVQYFKKYEGGIYVQSVTYTGITWKDGRFVKVHHADPERVQLFMLHNAYEYHRMGEILPKLYSHAKTLS